MNVEFLETLKPLFDKYRYKVLWGGRGGSKSHHIAKALIILSTQSKLRILCTREFQNSLKESVHKLLIDQIDLLGLTKQFIITKDSITNKMGSQFIFTGLHNNITKIKSLEAIDIVWCEEAENISEESWSVLIPTIRKTGSEIWVSFNPLNEDDPTYQRLIVNTPPNSFVFKINWDSNPWLSKEILDEKDYLKQVDYDSYLYVWEGEFLKRSKAQVFWDKVRIDNVKPERDWAGPYYGMDHGFSDDPMRVTKCWVHNRRLYLEREISGLHVDIDKLPEYIHTRDHNARLYTIRADNARPEIISYLQRNGFPKTTACKKGPGSVEQGITFIRSFEEIIIDPSCVHTIEEAKLYKYKVDKLSGEVLPEIVDKFNHSWDSVRYSLEPLMPHKQPGKVSFSR